MGLMMSVLVFSIGVLEALACVEHVRQSYLPLDLGRKRRRLVLDVGSGTIRHRETRRSSEFQRDPHVFLRSIQAAVEEEGDEKESEELAAIFQAVEARNIHSTQIMNHQDPVFLSVNDIDESDSCASSEISRTSTPNTVIMNMSPGLDRGSVVESPYIPSDSFSELLGPEIDEVFSNQKDIGITKVDIEKFMCIREPDKQFESIDSNSPNIGEVLQSSNTQIVSKNSTVYTITNELLETKKTEINKGKSIDSTTDLLDTDIISIPVAESGIEKSTKDSLFTNSVLCDGHNTKIIMKNNELTCKSDKIGSNFDHPVIKDGEENTNNNIIINNTINFESQTATLKLPDNNKLSLLPNNTSVHNNDIVIQENDLEINHKINEISFNLSSIAETNNIETIEKCEILVESQAHSGKEPLIENKGKDEICETQLERVIESEKQSKNDEIQNGQTVLTNSINIVHHTSNYEYDRKKINGADQLNSLSEHENSAIVPKHENEPIQEVLLQAQLNESEMVSIKLDESKDKIIEEVIAGTIDNDESCRRIPDQSATVSNSDKNIAGSTNNDLDVCELHVSHNGQFDASGPIPTKPDVSNEFNKTIDHGMVKQDKDKETSSCIKVQTCNSLDSVNVCIDNNSNIAKETFSSDPGERKTIPTNGQANELIEAPHTPPTIEHVLVSKGDSILDSSCPKDKVISTQQELLSEDIVPTDSKSIIVEKEDKYLTNDVFRENVVEERSESNKVEIKEANVNAHHKPESIREVSKSEKIFDEAKHSTNISIDTTNIKEEVYSEKADSVKSEIVEECVRHLVDVVSEQQTSDCKSDYNNHIDTHRQCDSEETVVTKEEFKPSVQTIPTGIALNEEHQVDSLKEVCAEIIVSKDTKSKGVDTDTIYSINNNVSNESGNQEELIMSENAAANEDDATKKLRPVAPQTSRLKIETESKEEITSKDLLDVKESLKPLPQKEPAKDKGGKPSDRKAVKTDKGVLAKQETLNVSPFPDDVTLLVGDLPSQNQFTAVEDITSPDKAFWLIFSGEYTKAMSKDWHSGHFCCWQCDESLTGQRYVLRDDHPYCIKCYEQVFANTCDECSKVIGIDSKDLSYKDKHWHEACFLCSKCRVSLVDKQFGSKADKIYCGNCYDAQFASRCDGCGQIFRAGTKKMEYKTRQWHEQCFCCCVCKTAIGTKSFIPREQEIYCATCYEEKFATRCVKCNKIITSGGVTYKNEPWHRECFTCTNCSTSLAGQRFTSRDEKPYCAECFGELFAKRCTACCKPITGIGGTRFISFEDRHWHNDCFICASCRSSLVGRGFITDAEDILCTECAKQKLM